MYSAIHRVLKMLPHSFIITKNIAIRDISQTNVQTIDYIQKPSKCLVPYISKIFCADVPKYAARIWYVKIEKL